MGLSAVIKSTLALEEKVCRRAGLGTDWTAGANFNIFRVPCVIIVKYMFGVVTTLMGVGAAVPQIQHTPATVLGTQVPLSGPMATIAGDVAGSIYIWTGALAGVPAPGAVIGAADIAASPLWAGQVILYPGVIAITNAVACNAGIVDWYICYAPCQPMLVTPL
jgi:hypothetical protein